MTKSEHRAVVKAHKTMDRAAELLDFAIYGLPETQVLANRVNRKNAESILEDLIKAITTLENYI